MLGLRFLSLKKNKSTAIEEFRKVANRLLPELSYLEYRSITKALCSVALDKEIVESVALESLHNIKTDETYDPTSWGEYSILLAADKNWQLRLSLYTHSSEYIYTFPFHLMAIIVGQIPLHVDRYQLPQDFNADVFVPGSRLSEPIQEIYKHGEIMFSDSRSEVLDVRVERPVPVVKFISTPFAKLQWAFHRTSLEAIQAIASNPLDSELVPICMALKAMKRIGSDTILDKLSTHESHFVRWSAIQGLGHLNPELAGSKLRAALSDSHPHIRAAALKHVKTNGI